MEQLTNLWMYVWGEGLDVDDDDLLDGFLAGFQDEVEIEDEGVDYLEVVEEGINLKHYNAHTIPYKGGGG